MITSYYVWERIWAASQALMQLGIPDRERDAMIKAMVEVRSTWSVSRPPGCWFSLVGPSRPSQFCGKSPRAIEEDRTRADELLKWDRARATHCPSRRQHWPTPIGPEIVEMPAIQATGNQSSDFWFG